jgi:hypothetical protein
MKKKAELSSDMLENKPDNTASPQKEELFMIFSCMKVHVFTYSPGKI